MASVLEDVTERLFALVVAALPDAAVYDEEPVTEEPDTQFVLIGDDGDPESEAVSTFEQRWADLGCTSKYEDGSIPCFVKAWSADTDAPDTRQTAFDLLAAIEAAIRADRTLDGLVMIARIDSGSAVTAQADNGSWSAVQFEITYMAQV